MVQYVDKSALVAEIDNRIYRRKKEYNILEESEIWEDALKLKERINELVDLRTQILFNTLDTLEVKDANEALRTEYEKGRADVIADTLSWLANVWPQYCSNSTIIDAYKEGVVKD